MFADKVYRFMWFSVIAFVVFVVLLPLFRSIGDVVKAVNPSFEVYYYAGIYIGIFLMLDVVWNMLKR